MNPLFRMMNGQAQTPSDAAPTPRMEKQPNVDFNAAMEQLKANPAVVLKQAGFNVPQEYIGNNQQTVMHLIRSGQVGGPMMRMIAPILNRMGI